MRLTAIARRFLPPIVTDLGRYLLNGQAEVGWSAGGPEWEHMPDGWRVKDPKIKGWNVKSILDTQSRKWPEFVRLIRGNGPLGISHESATPENTDYASHHRIMSYAYVLALAARKRERISLLDWGGGIGHYYILSQALLPKVDIDYHCKDVPLLCQGGRELLPEASFHEDEEDCFKRSYDLVLVSGSLQYCEDWKRLVQRLASVTGIYLYITRLPIVERAASFVAVQRPYRYGYQTEYVGWFLNRREFLNHMDTLRMDLLREFLTQEKPYVLNAPEQGEHLGFLFRPKRSE